MKKYLFTAFLMSACNILSMDLHAVEIAPVEITPISEELGGFLRQYSNVTAEYEPMSVKERVSLAKMLYEKAKDFNDRIPELKPETKSWVDKELSACTGTRCNTIYVSNEFVHYGLKNNSNALVEVLGNLKASIGGNPNLEMTYWSLAVTFFRDRTVFEDYERLYEYSYLDFEHELGSIRAKLIGAAINSGVIRQYLQGRYLERQK